MTGNTDTVGIKRPSTAAKYQSERPLAVVTASSTHRSELFDLPLFCDMGAGINIRSLTTARMHGFKIHYEADPMQNIFEGSNNNIEIIGYTIIYIHQQNIKQPLKISVAKKLRRDGEVILSLRTLRRMGPIPNVWHALMQTSWQSGRRSSIATYTQTLIMR